MLATLTAVLTIVLIGLLLIPIHLFFSIMVIIDGYKMAERMKKGYRIMKGECWSSFTAIGVSLVETSPVFVTGSGKEPMEWKQMVAQVEASKRH